MGGDWYDAFEQRNGRLALTVGDVAGHGIDSAALMGQLRNALRAYAMHEDDPSIVVERLNQLLHHLGTDSFATLVFATYDPATGHLWWTHAGHPPGLLFSDGATSWLEADDVGGPLLGVWDDARFPAGTATLDRGGSLLLYTDGLIERRGSTLQEGFDHSGGCGGPLGAPAGAGPVRRHGRGALRRGRPRGRHLPAGTTSRRDRVGVGGPGASRAGRSPTPRSASMPRQAVTQQRFSSYQRNGYHSARGGSADEGRTYEELYEEAKRRKIAGRSKMSKTELERALGGR